MLISVLVTYALLARRHEAIAWWASGQSVYRLMLPGFFFALAMAFGSWLVQEHVMPGTNLKQDALRARIRGGEARAITRTGRQWLASTETRRFYSYEFGEDGSLIEPTVYELDAEAVHLAQVVSGKSGVWSDATHLKISDAETLALKGMEVERRSDAETTFAGVESPAVFKPTIDKPSQLSANDLKSYLNAAKQRGMDVSALAVALQRKYAGPFGIIIMALIGMPLAVSFGRKGTVIALCAAVVVGIAYWAVGGGFQQLGNHGLLRPSVAGWSPLVIFAAAGTYFLSRVERKSKRKNRVLVLCLWYSLGSGFPARDVLELFRGQRVDRDAQRAQLEARDLSVDFSRQQVNARRQRSLVLHQILNRQRLVRKAHVHHAGRMSFGSGEIDQAAFAKHDDPATARLESCIPRRTDASSPDRPPSRAARRD